tara:strand:+ start:43 stop:477 length:435 start_codon:yes stop_codon:yes gene_type:complete
MAVIQPKLTIVANSSAASNQAGPASIAVNLSATPISNTSIVTSLETQIYNTTASPVKVFDSANYGKSYIYMKNLETSAGASQDIYVGITEGTQNDMGTNSGGDDRTFTISAGEFVYFPWSGDQDVYVEGASADDKLEIWLFKTT